jgi:hypothetical protein
VELRRTRHRCTGTPTRHGQIALERREARPRLPAGEAQGGTGAWTQLTAMVPQGRRPLTPELGGGVGRLRAWPSAVRIEGKKKRMGAQETSEKKMGGWGSAQWCHMERRRVWGLAAGTRAAEVGGGRPGVAVHVRVGDEGRGYDSGGLRLGRCRGLAQRNSNICFIRTHFQSN